MRHRTAGAVRAHHAIAPSCSHIRPIRFMHLIDPERPPSPAAFLRVGRLSRLARALAGLCITASTFVSLPVHAQELAPPAAKYLDGALKTLERSSIHRKTVDWKALRDSAYAWADGASTPEEVWPALHLALRFVDPHSFLQTPRPMGAPRRPVSFSGAAGRAGPRSAPPIPMPTPALEDRIGYLVVPGFQGPNRPEFVDALQGSIREFDEAGACGWIVDLRFNRGGNMWPMLAGVGPLLGAERVGAFVNASNRVEPWYYRAGQAWAAQPEPPPGEGFAGKGRKASHRLRDKDAPVALLLSGATSSSGEAVAVAFLGRDNLRTFGDTTAGFNSANGRYRLPDGAEMWITNAMNRDRRGRGYALSIAPDEYVPWREDDMDDRARTQARAWLLEQPVCRGEN